MNEQAPGGPSPRHAAARWPVPIPARRPSVHAAVAGLLLAMAGLAMADADGDSSPNRLLAFIAQQVGGIDKLKVPARNTDIPVPPGKPGEPDRYITTEAKRFLGKMLFHDPVRSARININADVPVNLPAGTAFGGTVAASNPNVAAIVNATRQTGSCGTCHFGEAATKAGQQINLHVGAEGRGYTDEDGRFVVRRRTQPILVKKRAAPLFAGDTLVDGLPTLTDIDTILGQRVVTTPAAFRHEPMPTALLATGRLDELDSVGRMSMSVIGFAFNNRLLFGGFGGEPETTIGALNPFDDPAQENLTLLLLDAHRMIGEQSAELIKIPAYLRLFSQAFPREAAAAAVANDPTQLVNDVTVLRATATFLRTVVTRNTPFDRFIGGDAGALTPAQRRGARLFFTPATGGQGGAGCVSCHSGPMLNKQLDDPDVAGIGRFVEENFHNVGIGDHPVQALNALERGRLDPSKLGADGFPYHAEDTGRQEITRNPDHAFKFRSLTLRQLKDGGNFFHNASFSKLRDVVQYFNAGVPQDPTAGAASTLSPRFTNPRGPGYPRGLGLSARQVDDLTDFLGNALYDPAFVSFDPRSSTDAFQPHAVDLTYSRYRPDLAALGARDGFMPSGLPVDNNDPLSRRDRGLEFLDVTAQALPSRVYSDTLGQRQLDFYRITNNGSSPVDTHLLTVVRGLPRHARLNNASGTSRTGDPYLRLFLDDGVLQPGQSAFAVLVFTRPRDVARLSYRLELLSGQGAP